MGLRGFVIPARVPPRTASFPRKSAARRRHSRESGNPFSRHHCGESPPRSSFRRRPESILILLFGFRRHRETRLTSLCVSSAFLAAELLSFACPKESNQRKRHPRGCGHAGIPARVTSRAGYGV